MQIEINANRVPERLRPDVEAMIKEFLKTWQIVWVDAPGPVFVVSLPVDLAWTESDGPNFRLEHDVRCFVTDRLREDSETGELK
jgi:hypothetical protein